MTYKLYNNNILRIAVCIILAVIFCIVPLEHKMLIAEAAFTTAVAISVICSVLVAMGFTFGRVFLTDGIDAQFKKFSIAQTVESLKKLAIDIWENCPNIYAAVAACFPNGADSFNTAYRIIQTSPLLYQAIKRYIFDKYGNTCDDIENSLNSSFSKGNPFMYNGYVFYSSAEDAAYLPGYSEISLDGVTYGWEFVSYSPTTKLYTYRSYHQTSEGRFCRQGLQSSSEGSVCVVPIYSSINGPSEDFPYGSFSYSVRFPYIDKLGEQKAGFQYANTSPLGFSSREEYEAVVSVTAGNVSPGSICATEINDNVFSSNAADYPRYVYIYENTEEYIGKTAADVAAPAYSENCDSEVVDNIARTVTWVGDRTLCPIDDLQSAIPSAVIGNWVASWEADGTLCNISCYAEDGTIAWQGEVATSLTWSDVIARLGDISITGTIPGSAVGSFAAADAALNFDPLKIAGQTFSKKFPFCLPFDLYRAFKQFDYDTGVKAPVYEIPLNFGEQFGTHYIVLDMAKWTPVANIVKWCVYVSFMVSLIIITKKVMGGS